MRPVPVLLLLALLGSGQVLAQQQALMEYLERRLQAIEDRISLWHEQTSRYASELREVRQQITLQLEGLEKSKEGLRVEMDGMGGRLVRMEREMDYLETQKDSQPCVDVDDKLLEQQANLAMEKNKLKYAKLSGCKDMVSSMKGMKVLKRMGGPQGLWTKDMSTGSGKIYWFNSTSDDTLYTFPSIRDFSSSQGMALSTPVRMPARWGGTGHAIYRGFAFLLEEGAETRRLLKVSLSDGSLTDTSVLPFPELVPTYALRPHTYVDLAVDEEGLWAIYATRSDSHHLSLAKLDADTLAVMQLWTTPCPRENAEGAFVVCGTLYVVYNGEVPGRARVQCIYDVGDLLAPDEAPQVYFPRRQGSHSSLKYSPKERLLYAWDQGNQILYKLIMKDKLEV